MKIIFPKKFPQDIAKKALNELAKVEAGLVRPRKLWCTAVEVKVVDIGLRYRAWSDKEGVWEVMSHESYNKKLNQR